MTEAETEALPEARERKGGQGREQRQEPSRGPGRQRLPAHLCSPHGGQHVSAVIGPQ